MVFIHPRTLSLTTRRLIGRVDKRPVGCEYKTRAIFSHLSQINIFTPSQRNIFTPLPNKYFHILTKKHFHTTLTKKHFHTSHKEIFSHHSQRNVFTPLPKKYFHTSHKIEIRPKSRPKVINSRNKSHRDHIWGMFQL